MKRKAYITKNLSPVLIVELYAVAVLGIGLLFSSRNATQNITSATPLQSSTVATPVQSSASTTPLQKIFVNTKEGYSFKYIDTSILVGKIGQNGGLSDPATADTVDMFNKGVIPIGNSNEIFTVSTYSTYDSDTLTIDNLQRHLGGPNITIQPFTVGGKSGFKMLDSDSQITQYYVENTAKNYFLAVFVHNNDAEAQAAFSSFTLTK